MSDSAVRIIVIGSIIGLIFICITLIAICAMSTIRDIFIHHETMDTAKVIAQHPNSRITFDVGNTRIKIDESGIDATYNGNYENGVLSTLSSRNIRDLLGNIFTKVTHQKE